MFFLFLGSATLHAWQQLAQPNLGGILDSRPGVVTKGFRHLQLELDETYQFTDLEEDEPEERRNSEPTHSTSGLGSLPVSPVPGPYLPNGEVRAEAETQLKETGDVVDEDELTSGERVS